MVNDSQPTPTTQSPKRIVVVLGSAGSGKSVQSKVLAKDTGWQWLSTGKLLRESDDAQLHARLNRGELIDDAHVISVLIDAVESGEAGQTFIIDGFPRTAAQADWLLNWSKEQGYPIVSVIHLVVSREVAAKRLHVRNRDDDTEDAIAARFAEYDNVIQPVLKDFVAAGVPVNEVSADGRIEEIHTEILTQIT